MEKKDLQNLIDQCKALLEQTEPYQQKMKAGHSRKKKRVIGHGGQPNTPPFIKKPSMERSKSAPPIGETKINELRFKDIANKNKWTQINLDILKQNKKDKDEEININDELFDLIDRSYAYIGGHIDFKKASDIPSSHTGWAAVDVDLDKKPDAVRFWKIDKFGNVKLTGGGSDGTPLGKSSYIQYTVEMLKEDGVFAEMSDAIAHIMITRYNIPSVNDPDVVQKLLGSDKKITWIGEDPSGKYPNHKGWYVRELGGEPHKKIMLGNPLGVEKLNEVIRKKGSKFCLYSKKSGKNLGCYSSKKGAKKRERQVQYFKGLEEGILSGIMGLVPQQQKKPEIKYTDYNKVYDRIYVGSAPIHGGRLIKDAINNKLFGKIFVMSKEVADLIQENHPKLPDKIDLNYAIKDTLNPTEEEKRKLDMVAIKAKAFLNTSESGILFVCSKGLNRSVTGACLTMKKLNVDPEKTIEYAKAARGPRVLTLGGAPQEHAGFVPIIKQIEQKK